MAHHFLVRVNKSAQLQQKCFIQQCSEDLKRVIKKAYHWDGLVAFYFFILYHFRPEQMHCCRYLAGDAGPRMTHFHLPSYLLINKYLNFVTNGKGDSEAVQPH